MQDDNTNDELNQPEENPDGNVKNSDEENIDSGNASGDDSINDTEAANAGESQEGGSSGEPPGDEKTTTIEINKDKRIGEEEKKGNKKIFVIAGIAIILTIILIVILLLFMFCKNNDIPENNSVETTIAEETADASNNNGSTSSTTSGGTDVTEETEETAEPVEENPDDEIIEETPETEATTEEAMEKPTISLEIIEGPVYSPADNVCYYRVKANTTGTAPVHVDWSDDASDSSFGENVAQVNLSNPSQTYTLTGTATNAAGSANDSITLSWGCNRPPDVTAINIASEVIAGSSNSATAVATDPDGDAITFSWNVNGGSLSNAGINPANWTAPAEPGSYRITVTVNDGKGGTDSISKNITVIAQNRPPEVSNISVKNHSTQASASYAVTGLEYDLSVNASDPDGDVLNFSWSLSGSINPGSLSNSGRNPALWTAPYSTTWVTITVIVDDGNGGTVTRNREIEVRYEMVY